MPAAAAGLIRAPFLLDLPLQGRLWDLPFGLLHLYTDALGRVWRLTMDGVGAAEHLASAAFGAAIGGSQVR